MRSGFTNIRTKSNDLLPIYLVPACHKVQKWRSIFSKAHHLLIVQVLNTIIWNSTHAHVSACVIMYTEGKPLCAESFRAVIPCKKEIKSTEVHDMYKYID